jgi:hypothetical protein
MLRAVHMTQGRLVCRVMNNEMDVS